MSVAEGSLENCEKALLGALIETYGSGRPNIPLRTLGGKQFWADVYIHAGWRIQENVYTGFARLLDPDDVRRAWGDYESCRVAFERERSGRGIRWKSRHLVLLLHGLFRSKDSFSKMERALENAGYSADSVNYPSTRRSIREHADQLERLLGSLEGIDDVSFVTHSLGGIVVRELLANDGAWRRRVPVRRLVMLGPPNRGSVVAEALGEWMPYEVVAGESGQGLTPEHVAEIPAPDVEFGVIAGGTGDEDGFNPQIPGDDDGTVSVDHTQLPTAGGFLLVRELHSFLMESDEVIAATLRFLENGSFAQS